MRIADVPTPATGTPLWAMSHRQRSLLYGFRGGIVADLRRTADKVSLLHPAVPYDVPGRLRRAATRIEELQDRIAAMEEAAQTKEAQP